MPLRYVTLRYVTLRYVALHCIALHCIALHCIALHCIALHCIALRYIYILFILIINDVPLPLITNARKRVLISGSLLKYDWPARLGSFNYDTHWLLLNMYSENFGFGAGGFCY